MNVKELKKILENVPDDFDVVFWEWTSTGAIVKHTSPSLTQEGATKKKQFYLIRNEYIPIEMEY